MEGYAYSVLNEWGLGSSDRDNGVLLLLAPGEDDYYITRGTGLESALSISTLGTILDDKMEPNWVSGDYDAGVCATVAAIADKLCGIYGVTLDTSSVANNTSGRNRESNIMGFIMVIIAVILIIWVISTLTRPPVRPAAEGPVVGALAVICSGTAWAVLPVGPRRPPPRRPRRRAALVLAVVPAPRLSPRGYRTGGGMGGFGGAGRSAALVHRAPLAVPVHPAATTPAAVPAVAAV